MINYRFIKRTYIRSARHVELVLWVMALLLIFFLDTHTETLSLCFFKWMGIGFCPGCGIAHAMHEVMHGNIAASFQHHPLGVFAVVVIGYRIFKLLFFQHIKPYIHESS